MHIPLILALLVSARAIFFGGGGGGGGGGGCCCGCGTPQPSSCGCQTQCPPPAPCPACVQQICAPPPTAYCPQVQPVYYQSCTGDTCSGGCSGSGCGGGGGGGYASAPTGGGGGGYAIAPQGGGGGGYAAASQGGGGGYAAAPQGGGGGYAASPFIAPLPALDIYAGGGGGGGGYQAGGGAGPYVGTGTSAAFPQQPVAPSNTHEAAVVAPPQETSEAAAVAPAPTTNNYVPPEARFRAQAAAGQIICQPQKIKYVVLRAKKTSSGNEEFMEEGDEIDNPTFVEATASPLALNDLGNDITLNAALDEEDEQSRARAALTFTDAKCNSKPLRELILENIVKDDALTSKRAIHDSSLKRFPDATVDVICSNTGFTYLVSTIEHCEAQKDNVICFIYKRPL